MSTSAVTSSASGGTNINVASIVSQLMTVEQQPLNQLSIKQAGIQARISAYGSVQGALSSFQSSMLGLNSASALQGLTASPSDSTVMTASASNIASPGSYSIGVTSLAQSQQLVATGQASQTAAIGLGGSTTLTFDFGTIAGNTLNATTGKYGTTLSATTTTGSTTVTAPTANLAVGATISGAGIPAGATVVSITDANNFVISAAATASGTGIALQAGATFTSNGSGTKTVTITAANNSLQGIRDAINAANIGVTASIINDGSANPYRLSLTSNSQGASNSVKISVTPGVAGDTALSNLLAEDPANSAGQSLTQTTAAQNANFTVNGIAVTKTSNSVSDVIHGVTLNLLKASATPVTLSVAQNTSAISTAVNNFVKAYNDLHSAITSVTSYDPVAQKGAILQGDFSVNTLANQVRQILNTTVSGASGLTSLADIGVTFQKDGTLAVDSTKLNTAISSNYSNIAALFGTVGSASDSLISYTSATSTVKPGSYAVNISQIATQGNIVGNAAAGTTITAGVNDTLNVTVDGTTTGITLAPGSYTAAALAAQLQTQINGSSAITGAGASVAVSQSGGIFTITSNSYGSKSNVVVSGNGAANLLGAAPVSLAGVDVAGTIDGQASTGFGQFLTSGGGNSFGLKIQVNGGALGARGTVNYAQGYAYSLSQYATAQMNSGGLLQSATTGLNNQITDIQKQQAELQVRLASIQASYTSQFTALDSMLSSMNSTQQYLTQQLANLPKA